MPITRRFIDWNQPALPAVAEYLIERYQSPAGFDLGNVILVVPGRRAGRRLVELLLERTADSDHDFVPPRTVTFSQLPELLYRPQRPFAGKLMQKLVWGKAIREVDPKLLAPYIPVLPDTENLSGWMALAEMLWQQHREMAGDGLDFHDLMEQGIRIPEFTEAERWLVLREIQARYLVTLDDLDLWDLQTARLFAIDGQECKTDHDVILVGTVDMNRSGRRMIDQIAEHVTALIHAPEAIADHFDEHGCLIPDAWNEFEIDLSAVNVKIVSGPDDQADAVVQQLSAFDGHFRPDEITVGLPDESLAMPIARRLALAGVAARSAVAGAVSATGVYRFLAGAADYIAGVSRSRQQSPVWNSDAFAALVRHPDVNDWVNSADDVTAAFHSPIADKPRHWTDWLVQLDDYRTRHLQPMFTTWQGGEWEYDVIRAVRDSLHRLLAPLLEDDSGRLPFEAVRRPLSEWNTRLVDVLYELYGQRMVDRDAPADHIVIDACEAIHDALQESADIPDSFMPVVSADQSIRLLLESLHDVQLPPLHDDDAIELLGWLELPLDDSPALIVTGFNEGAVPKSVNSDLFLPERMRRELGLVDNARRYARDAYALAVLVASRESLTLIAGRRDQHADPLRPSRLLFATADAEVPHRVLDFYSDSDESTEVPAGTETLDDGGLDHAGPDATPGQRESTQFVVPKPGLLPEPSVRIGVSSFKTYLNCPYRFYLRHILHLDAVQDSDRELTPRTFGNLLHDVLESFGRSPERNARVAADINAFLRKTLFSRATQLFGRDRPAGLAIQLRQLELRLEAFATAQANWASEGWTIHYAEDHGRTLQTELTLPSGRSIELHGRIDRIDYRAATEEWVIFDYKSGEDAAKPELAHWSSRTDEWRDLQLPLYRHLAEPLGVHGAVACGYIVLPKDLNQIGMRIADWDDEFFDRADRKIHEVAEAILDQQFWPPAELSRPPEELAGICQDNVFDRELEP